MTLDRRALLAGTLAAAPTLAQPLAKADPSEVIRLWPDGAPGGSKPGLLEQTVERARPGQPGDRAVFHVTEPRLTVFRPAKPNGDAALLVPGGSYARVVIDKEGFELGRWLAARGTTAYVLFYRLPADGWQAGPDAALQDVQRAVRLVRAQTPRRLLSVGFSAGGHVNGMLATRHGDEVYAPADAADRLSAKPDAVALIYPVISMRPGLAHAESRANLLGAAPGEDRLHAYSVDERAGPQVPPTFLVHAADDASVSIDNTLAMHTALRKAQVPVEAHLFQEGGHGFGLRGAAGKPAAAWPGLLAAWWERQPGAGARGFRPGSSPGR